jgi:hypothetical protein
VHKVALSALSAVRIDKIYLQFFGLLINMQNEAAARGEDKSGTCDFLQT